MRRWLKLSPVMLASAFAAACTAPSVDDCQSIIDPDARVNCLTNAMYGEVLHGAGIGAVGGALVGAAIGGAISRGPGAITGAIGGATGGALAGGAVAYIEYNRERAAGDNVRMYRNAIADLRAENFKLRTLIASYVEQINHNTLLIEKLNTDDRNKDASISEARKTISKINSERKLLSDTLQIAKERQRTLEDYFNRTNSSSGQADMQIQEMKKNISELEQANEEKGREIAFLNERIEVLRRQLMAPDSGTQPES